MPSSKKHIITRSGSYNKEKDLFFFPFFFCCCCFKMRSESFSPPSQPEGVFTHFCGYQCSAAGILLSASLYSKCKHCTAAPCSSTSDLLYPPQPLWKKGCGTLFCCLLKHSLLQTFCWLCKYS